MTTALEIHAKEVWTNALFGRGFAFTGLHVEAYDKLQCLAENLTEFD